MAGWVQRSLEAREKQREAVLDQKQEEAKSLAMRVSRLMGEVFQMPPAHRNQEVSLIIKDNFVPLEFVFCEGRNDALALRWECPVCKQHFLTPVSTLADVGEIVYNATNQGLHHTPKLPDHKSCPGKPTV